MLEPAAWISRTWTFGIAVDLFSQVLERLRGTPPRAEELVRSLPGSILSKRRDGAWSVHEHLGHLSDMNALDDKRVTEFLEGATALSAADMTNQATELARHNDRSVHAILERLRSGRQELVARLEVFPADLRQHVALHPRLRQPMTIVDWMYFVAEHDDHHLAYARHAATRIAESSEIIGLR
jgi:hypothetical protein